MNIPLTIVIVVVGGCLAIVGSLIVLNLRSIKGCLRNFTERMNRQDKTISNVQRDIMNLQSTYTACRLDCDRTFVGGEVFLRETGFARRSLESLTASVNRLDGKLTVVEKLPQICGDISRAIVSEMKNGANS